MLRSNVLFIAWVVTMLGWAIVATAFGGFDWALLMLVAIATTNIITTFWVEAEQKEKK